MAEFNELRRQLRETRGAIERMDDEVATVRERLRQIATRQSALDRVFNPDDRQHVAEKRQLEQDRAHRLAELERVRDARRRGLAAEAGIYRDFARFTDPRENISRLSDATPILLMPVRLETRFKDVTTPGGAAQASQLWVRIYPDDCWIDTFDPALTETEVTNAKLYWTGIWQAGGIEDQERGAWRGLVGSHGTGRARWISQQFQPTNLAQKPSKPRAIDVILTVATDAALPAAEASATIAFWRDAWLADGDAVKTQLARSTLDNAVGPARAEEIIAAYQPANFSAKMPTGVTKGQVNVSVAFVIFPAIQTKQNAWSRAPKLTLLPDRFVFIGYRGSDLPVIALGNPAPSSLMAGPDPGAGEDDQLQHDDDGNLIVPDELKWMSDFDRAVDVGMGFRIPLTNIQRRDGFDRILVIGLRLNADEHTGKTELETLLTHHAFTRKGLSIVKQGTPTNNTEALGSGHGRLDDPDQSFDDGRAPLFVSEAGWLDKKDGQWLAEYLGIDPSLFLNVHDAGSSDQLAGRAMNMALWPATLGYWMETMMAPVFSADVMDQARAFFSRYVIGAGAIPAIRIGAQPYGILPATAWSRLRWFEPGQRDVRVRLGGGQDSELAFLRHLYRILLAMQTDWRMQLSDVSFVGKSGDPHRVLLDIVGLHSGSVEWSQRYAESLKTLFNRLNLQGFGGMIEAIILHAKRAVARQLLTNLGYTGEATPQILERVFSGRHNLLKGGIVDEALLSEVEAIRQSTADGRNYVQWLIDAANDSIQALYAQEGFKDDKAPSALLYLLLRHALQLGYHDVSVRLHENAGLFTPAMAVAARADDPFLHIRQNIQASESRYQPLYAVQSAITGSTTQTVGQFIAARLDTLTFTFHLREQLAALERLKAQPTARLERAFADHVDCCSYRLDAWLLALVQYQLALMRNLRDGVATKTRQGIHLGAYGWLEPLKPENKVLTPVRLRDPDLIADFAGATDPPLMRDSTNQGYIHAPSLNHAVAAAVLRNGFISNASPANRQTMAVNLTSERVRTALAMLEGIRAGQGLADLLGYQFERGLHDRHGLIEVDKFIYKLRKAFPLRADRLQSTRTEEGVPIEAIEARNVIDGLALVEHMRTTGQTGYPFGKTTLPSATNAEADAINAEAVRLLDAHDAIADLALAEGVYQAVVGNYDRVASTYDAYARGHFPPEPDVIRTPLNGIGLTHRVGLHLRVGASPSTSPVPGVAMTPRAQAEPALNAWLADVLPPLTSIGCVVSLLEASTGTNATHEITLRQLELQPADLLPLVRDDNRQAMTELDDRITRFAVTHFGPRPDVPLAIRYMEKVAAPFSVFEVMPLVRDLRRLTTKSRPLKASDLTLMNEATSAQDSTPAFDKLRLDTVRNAMQTLRNDLAAFQAQIEGPLSDLANRRGEILAQVDDFVTDLVELLARAATFVIPQSGWGFAYDFQRQTFAAILRQCAALVTRWDERLAEFDATLTEHDALPATATDEERFALLTRAEQAISTIATTPLPATPALFRTDLLTVKRPAFVAKRDQFDDIQDTTETGVAPLRSAVAALLPIADFDAGEFTLTAHDDAMVRFAEDIVRVVSVVIAALDRRLDASQSLFDVHDASASAVEKVQALENAAKMLLGDDFRIIPSFTISKAQGDEIDKALAASNSDDLFLFLKSPPDPATPPLDFPVDTWLHGVARVREKMHAWEQMTIVAGALGRPEPKLDAMQLPFIPNDRWLALEMPPDLALDTDRLLHTAHFAATFDKTLPQGGLLVDEWTETIPGSTADTGITFHFDRPDCEAPQTMLLVTPAEFRGEWGWADLVDALNETVDLAMLRAVEPVHVDRLAYAPFLPAAIMATQARQLTIAADLAINNKILLRPQS